MGSSKEEIGARMRRARLARGFATATDAANRMNIPIGTYPQYENGTRAPSRTKLELIARTFRVSYQWLVTGSGQETARVPMAVPIVGLVGAGGKVQMANNLGELEAPPDATAATAVLVTGEDAMPYFEDGQFSYFYEQPKKKKQIPPNAIGKLCVVALADGRILVRRVNPGSRSGRYHLTYRLEQPLFDQQVTWAAEISWIRPR